MPTPKPKIIDDLMTDRAGRGRGLDKNGKPNKPKFIVAHRQEGKGNPKSWFLSLGLNNPTSADCTIWISYAGIIKRLLHDTDTAWTNGSSKNAQGKTDIDFTNKELIGMTEAGVYSGDISLTIEFEGYTKEPITPAQVASAVDLVAYWCETYNIPCERTYFIGHYQVGQHKYCPGANFPFDEILRQAKNTIKDLTNYNPKTNLDAKTISDIKPIKIKENEVTVKNETSSELTFKDTKYKVMLGFKDFYLSFGGHDVGLRLFGLPKEDEHADLDGITRQKFERYTMRYNPKETNKDWIISGEHVN